MRMMAGMILATSLTLGSFMVTGPTLILSGAGFL